jgi:carbon storage regulator
MLILSRKSNESIVIGDNIRITVASIRGRYVRVGVEAPKDIAILREELCIERANLEAPVGGDLTTWALAESEH